jgi:hypothetical protein
MTEQKKDDYFYIDPTIIIKQGCGGKEFLCEQVNSFISTIQCMKRIISSCVDNYEIENLKHCLSKLRSSMAELKVKSLMIIIEKLITSAEKADHKEMLSENLNEFL